MHLAVSIGFQLPGHLRGWSKSKPSRFGSILLLCVADRFGLAENKSNSFVGTIRILNHKRLLADFVNSSCTFLSAVDINWEKRICR